MFLLAISETPLHVERAFMMGGEPTTFLNGLPVPRVGHSRAGIASMMCPGASARRSRPVWRQPASEAERGTRNPRRGSTGIGSHDCQQRHGNSGSINPRRNPRIPASLALSGRKWSCVLGVPGRCPGLESACAFGAETGWRGTSLGPSRDQGTAAHPSARRAATHQPRATLWDLGHQAMYPP